MRWAFAVLLVIGCGGGKKAGDAKPGGEGSILPGDGKTVDGDLSCAGVSTTVPALKEKTIATGLNKPVYIAHPPGSADLYVVEKPGTIRIVRAGAVLPAPFLDVTADVNIPSSDSEGGLLGLAFKPDYATSGRFFVYMTLKTDGTLPDRAAVREYHRSATNADVADPTVVGELINARNDGYGQIGGTILFGSDGKLWIGTGDAVRVPSPAADVTSRLGKMLRLDVDAPATPPSDNLGGSADPYVWDYGLRNPYRFSFDDATDALYIADAGDTMFEEVDIELPGAGHQDYGWDRREGNVCHTDAGPCDPPGTAPAYVRAHDTDLSVIIGGNVYRGSALPQLRGRYIFGIFSFAGRVSSFVYCGGAVTSEVELTNMFADTASITGFGEDATGELYFVTLDGALYEIVPG